MIITNQPNHVRLIEEYEKEKNYSKELIELLEDSRKERKALKEEISFLKERNKDLRQKSWFEVYEENLTLTKTIDQMRNELIQMGQLAEKFHLEANNLKQENEKLKGVLKSVETFIGQYTIR